MTTEDDAHGEPVHNHLCLWMTKLPDEDGCASSRSLPLKISVLGSWTGRAVLGCHSEWASYTKHTSIGLIVL